MPTREERQQELETIQMESPNRIFEIFHQANGGKFDERIIGMMGSQVIKLILDLEFPSEDAE